MSLDLRRRDLEERLSAAGSLVIAYSGGVDSACLTAVAHDVLGAERVLAATAVSPSLARRDLLAATDLARERGWNHVTVATDEVVREEYARNATDRCYWCKDVLFAALAPIAARREARLTVGTNKDDLADFRPGHGAARRHRVLAPLADAKLGKDDVRTLARSLDLPVWDRPASPCLSSRVAYGVRVTQERLERIDAAEEFLRDLGFGTLRVRDHGDLARVEVPAEEVENVMRNRTDIVERLEELGWRYVTLDLKGFRSGAMNEVLVPRLRSREE